METKDTWQLYHNWHMFVNLIVLILIFLSSAIYTDFFLARKKKYTMVESFEFVVILHTYLKLLRFYIYSKLLI